jgi:hypothetical protein
MEMAQGLSQGQETNSSPGLTSSAQGTAQISAPVQASDERVFKQSEVNEIVKRAKVDAEERVKRIYSEQPDYAARKYGDTSFHDTSRPQQSSLTEDQARKIAAEEAQRLHDQRMNEARTRSDTEAAQRIVGNFWNKLEAGRKKFTDFDSVTSDIEYAQFPNVVHVLSEHIDNADEVMYELGQDPMKLASLELLASKSLKKGVLQAQRLSQSIKDNNAASKMKVPKEPLSQLRPTNLGTDNGVMSVSDFRKKYRG